jgi:pilus assembly protein Flp/PilA
MLKGFRKLVQDESGATAIEYALIASLISVFIIAALQSVGTQVSSTFNSISNSLKSGS